jgi:hypothetical protein
MRHYDDKINWAFSSAVKNKQLAASNDGAGVAILQGNGNVSLNNPLTLSNLVSFFRE